MTAMGCNKDSPTVNGQDHRMHVYKPSLEKHKGIHHLRALVLNRFPSVYLRHGSIVFGAVICQEIAYESMRNSQRVHKQSLSHNRHRIGKGKQEINRRMKMAQETNAGSRET